MLNLKSVPHAYSLLLARRGKENCLAAVLRGFDVRPATQEDIPRLAELERLKFGNTGMDVYDERYFRCWLDTNPEGLLVATHDGVVEGYRYSQYVDFALSDIPTLTTNDAFTDGGFTKGTHKPSGNSINGVSVCSAKRGAGRVLFEVIFEQLKNQGRRYYFGFSRIPGLRAYIQGLQSHGVGQHLDARRIAAWYAHQCAKRVNGLVWDTMPPEEDLGLPPLTQDDPVLSLYLRHKGFGMASLLPHAHVGQDWIKDPKSMGFAVLVLFKNDGIA